MVWTNDITKQFANANVYCPIKLIDMTDYSDKTAKSSVLAIKLKNQFLNKNSKDLFLSYLTTRAAASIDWIQLADYWDSQVRVKGECCTQMQLL